jgi:hypothetical protein
MPWECPVCGRTYTDAEPTEIAEWEKRLKDTGYCCDYCEEDNKPEAE